MLSTAVAPPVQFAVAVQIRAPYHCFICGAAAAGVTWWPIGTGHSPLDSCAEHIAYLVPTCECHRQRLGCTRVAVLGGLITPLRFATSDEIPDFWERTQYNADAVDAALAILVAEQDAIADEIAQNQRDMADETNMDAVLEAQYADTDPEQVLGGEA